MEFAINRSRKWCALEATKGSSGGGCTWGCSFWQKQLSECIDRRTGISSKEEQSVCSAVGCIWGSTEGGMARIAFACGWRVPYMGAKGIHHTIVSCDGQSFERSPTCWSSITIWFGWARCWGHPMFAEASWYCGVFIGFSGKAACKWWASCITDKTTGSWRSAGDTFSPFQGRFGDSRIRPHSTYCKSLTHVTGSTWWWPPGFWDTPSIHGWFECSAWYSWNRWNSSRWNGWRWWGFTVPRKRQSKVGCWAYAYLASCTGPRDHEAYTGNKGCVYSFSTYQSHIVLCWFLILWSSHLFASGTHANLVAPNRKVEVLQQAKQEDTSYIYLRNVYRFDYGHESWVMAYVFPIGCRQSIAEMQLTVHLPILKEIIEFATYCFQTSFWRLQASDGMDFAGSDWWTYEGRTEGPHAGLRGWAIQGGFSAKWIFDKRLWDTHTTLVA